jgi:hypothetical protein
MTKFNSLRVFWGPVCLSCDLDVFQKWIQQMQKNEDALCMLNPFTLDLADVKWQNHKTRYLVGKDFQPWPMLFKLMCYTRKIKKDIKGRRWKWEVFWEHKWDWLFSFKSSHCYCDLLDRSRNRVGSTVARFFLVQNTKTGKKYTKLPRTIPNVHKR